MQEGIEHLLKYKLKIREWTADRWYSVLSNLVFIKGLCDDKKFIFYTYGNFCSFECVYTFIYNEHVEKIKAEYINSKYLFKTLFTMLFPDQKIKRLPHWTLLKEHGGALTEEEYFTTKYEYENLPSHIEYHPVKMSIEQIKR